MMTKCLSHTFFQPTRQDIKLRSNFLSFVKLHPLHRMWSYLEKKIKYLLYIKEFLGQKQNKTTRTREFQECNNMQMLETFLLAGNPFANKRNSPIPEAILRARTRPFWMSHFILKSCLLASSTYFTV